jgi:glutamyl-tRNA synthetase/glutamyl-Q tRNA(Asp) synthetase
VTRRRPDLAVLAHRLPPHFLTRFAPSPTGYLHLGHVVNAIYVWGLARALGGRVLLRMEDHDRSRSRPGFEAAILDDLEWLGLEPDTPSPASLRRGASPYRQSDSEAIYRRAISQLGEMGLLFACDCSRKTIASQVPAHRNEEPRYPGRCESRGLADGPGRGLRLRLASGLEPFNDGLLGPQLQDPEAQCGALLLRDRSGQWTYHLAVTVDDWRHEIDLVVRGADLLASTGRQLRLARLLGRPRPPLFIHHPLILRPDGTKLSKANRDAGIRDLRAAGRSPQEVLGMAAHACGLLPAQRALAVGDLASLFTGNGDR